MTRKLRRIRIGSFAFPVIAVIPITMFLIWGVVSLTNNTQKRSATPTPTTQVLTANQAVTTPTPTPNDTNQTATAPPAPDQISTDSTGAPANKTSPSTQQTPTPAPATNPNNPSFDPSQCSRGTIVPIEGRSLSLNYDQEGVVVYYTTPDGSTVGMVSGGLPGFSSPTIQSGQYTSSLSVYVPYPGYDGSGSLVFATSCLVYSMPVTMTRLPKPVINITSIEFIEPNNISYSADRPISYLTIGYYINSCQSPDTSVCMGYDTVYTTAQSGTFSLDPYFPVLDTYFATYPPSSINLTVMPVSSEQLMTGNSGILTFSP